MWPSPTHLVLALALAYALMVLSFYTGLSRVARRRAARDPADTKLHRISVVVAARNEARNIRACLDALLAQDYRSVAPLEIVVVNDRSSDETGEILAGYARDHAWVRIVDVESCPADFAPKKYALAAGIAAADGEIICTTDADCVVPPTWVSSMAAHFDDDVGLVAGPALHSLRQVERQGRRWLDDFIWLESLIGVAVAGGSIGWQRPWTCSGANLAYRVEALADVGGFRAIRESLSGDDDLLMFRIAETTAWRIDFALEPGALVRGVEDPGFLRTVHQRSRRLSKFRLHPLRVQLQSVMLASVYVLFLGLPLYALATGELLGAWAVLAGSRFAVEYLAMSRAARSIGERLRLLSFARSFPLHPLAIVVFGLMGNLSRSTWTVRPEAITEGHET